MNKTHKYRGYLIRRGDMQGTCDNRLDRWYIDHEDSTTAERGHDGWRTLAEALAYIDWWLLVDPALERSVTVPA